MTANGTVVRHRRRNDIAWDVGLACASLAVGVLLCEVTIRMVAPQQLIRNVTEAYAPDSILGWTHGRNIRLLVNTGERAVDLTTDADGYRVSDRGPLAPDRYPAPLVLALGDSFVEGLQVPYDSSVTARLEVALRSGWNSRATVVNTAVGGYGLNQYYLIARRELARRPVHLVLIFVYVANDPTTDFDTTLVPTRIAQRNPLAIPRNLGFDELKTKVLRPLNDYLEERSHFFVFLKTRGESLLARLGLTVEYFPPLFLKQTASHDVWAATARALMQLDALCSKHGATAVFMLIPAPYQVHQELFERYVTMYNVDTSRVDLFLPNRRLSEECARVGVQLFDLTSPLKGEAITGKRLYGVVDRHLSPAGHEVISREVFRFILGRGLLDRQQPRVDAGSDLPDATK